MAIKISLLSSLLLLCFNHALLFSSVASVENRKSYIVYMGGRPEGDERSAASRHLSLLQDSIGSTFPPDYLLYNYKRSFDGFVAYLSEDEAQIISGLPDVVSVFPDEALELETTGSWDFLGFPEDVQRNSLESDIIVGIIDSGIWPESQSFIDTGYGPPPSKWKGSCQVTADDPNFACNKDTNGHGTHVASTAAGGLVRDVSFQGFARGTARGGVPSARIASYKVCWRDGCWPSDILAAFDDAIADGVDIISVSISSSALNYFGDSISIGSFGAMQNGILTSTSAGNTGPNAGTTRKFAPWFLSVAASTTNRKFITKGISINTIELGNNQYPLIYAGDAPNLAAGFTGSTSRTCSEPNSLDANLVRGRIVLCDWSRISGVVPRLAGAVGMVIANDTWLDNPSSYQLPASHVNAENGRRIFQYILSSGGPNVLTPDILKPDISAPGVTILAAGAGSTFPYILNSGTSMAAPHATAIAAYVKTFHPTWSPAAIRSALMSTATPMSSGTNRDAEFAYGAGNLNPLGALTPGLVYDAEANDYVSFLCGQGLDTHTLRLITRDDSACTEANNGTVWDLNYPSFAVSTPSREIPSRVLRRVVTNVGSADSTYRALITAPPNLSIHVHPETLSFTSLGQKLEFTVVVGGILERSVSSGALVWDDGVHKVRSPIVAYYAAWVANNAQDGGASTI
ncbi:hypothetical protein Tsubulata_049923 [Turnera subulata]|uniref:Cucumisin-like n=1 Tax=Turnera subulata TaxID=218843 RepID=A0A9Q0F7F0_9ROSI|nr:hypothetical protein Tsubulata_049923 [Turnera subulata]